MKKIYILAIVMIAFTFTANAQFADDIEGYPLGILSSNAIWGDWDGTDGTADDISVSSDVAHSGTQSILIAEGAVIDGVMKLGDKTSGLWYLDWWTFVPSGSTAYFNIQETETPGTQWNYDIQYNEDSADEGGLTIYNGATALATGTYPTNEWFSVSMVIDLDTLSFTFAINNVEVYSGDYTGLQLGGVNFYSIDAANRYYIDDVRFDTTPPTNSIEDLQSLGFTAYPNPVQNKLFLNADENITNVTIFNVIGQQVKSVTPNALTSEIDMSNLESGIYFVKVNIGSAVGTIKILK